MAANLRLLSRGGVTNPCRCLLRILTCRTCASACLPASQHPMAGRPSRGFKIRVWQPETSKSEEHGVASFSYLNWATAALLQHLVNLGFQINVEKKASWHLLSVLLWCGLLCTLSMSRHFYPQKQWRLCRETEQCSAGATWLHSNNARGF